jgi:hypothetical protein
MTSPLILQSSQKLIPYNQDYIIHNISKQIIF